MKVKESLSFLSENDKEELLGILQEANIGICKACGNLCYLVKHHWWEETINEGISKHTKWICNKCNRKLVPRNFYGDLTWGDHLLPSWDIQLLFIKLDYHYGKWQYYNNGHEIWSKTPFIEYLEKQEKRRLQAKVK